MIFITWACLRCVQELATILGPQNPAQRSCEVMEQKENERHGQKFYDIFSVENCLTYTHQSIKDQVIKDSSIL